MKKVSNIKQRQKVEPDELPTQKTPKKRIDYLKGDEGISKSC